MIKLNWTTAKVKCKAQELRRNTRRRKCSPFNKRFGQRRVYRAYGCFAGRIKVLRAGKKLSLRLEASQENIFNKNIFYNLCTPYRPHTARSIFTLRSRSTLKNRIMPLSFWVGQSKLWCPPRSTWGLDHTVPLQRI